MSDTQEMECLATQSRLRGRYIIIEMVGQGGMGSVYKAIDAKANNRLVAVKEMCLDHYSSHRKQKEAQKLFRREAWLLDNLSHSNLPRVYAFFNEGRRFYLVMDFIEGKTLEQLLKETATGFLPIEDTLHYALQLCDVLSYLHHQIPPVIFRDLKPSNVMVTAQGHIYLIDFGIARIFKQGSASDTQLLGTPGFASPEQHGNGQTGPRSDLYSLGATLHYCLTSKEPRTNKPTLFDFLPPHDLNAQVPLSLSELIQRLVSTREDLRPPNAEAVQRELLSIHQPTSNTVVKDKSSYDRIIVYATQFNSWILHQTGQLRSVKDWLLCPVIRLLGNVPYLLYTWFLLTILPHLKQLSRNYIRVSSVRLAKPWQNLLTTQTRWLIQDVWTPHFTFLFILFAIAMTGGSMLMLTILHYPVSLVALYLCLFLILQIGIAYKKQHIYHPLIHKIFKILTLTLFFTSIALFADSDIQSTIQTSMLAPFMHINQAIACGLILIACILVYRRRHPFKEFDQFSLLCVALVCAFLQSAAWYMKLSLLPVSSLNSPILTIKPSQLFMLVITKLFTQAFMVIVLIALAITISSTFLCLAKEFAWVDQLIMKIKQRYTTLDKRVLQLNHFILTATSVTCIFLVWSGENGRLQFTPRLIFETFSQLTNFILSLCLTGVLLVLTLLLIICSITALMRLSRPFGNIDRQIVLINSIIGALLLFSGYTQQMTMPDLSKITSVKPWLADPQIMHPSQDAAFGLLFAALVALMWVRRRIPNTYRKMLKIGFGLTLLCAMLQWLTPAFLLAGLIMLTLSIIIAIQMEQVQSRR